MKLLVQLFTIAGIIVIFYFKTMQLSKIKLLIILMRKNFDSLLKSANIDEFNLSAEEYINSDDIL